MICYRDMTFCISENCTNECGRKLTPEIREAAEEWWQEFADDGSNAPIAVAKYCEDDNEKED